MQQLVLMTMSDSSVVVQQACKTLGLLAKHSAGIADEIVDCDVLSAALTLITSTRYTHQVAGLQLIADLAFASESAAVRLMTPDLLVAMQVWRRNVVVHSDVAEHTHPPATPTPPQRGSWAAAATT